MIKLDLKTLLDDQDFWATHKALVEAQKRYEEWFQTQGDGGYRCSFPAQSVGHSIRAALTGMAEILSWTSPT